MSDRRELERFLTLGIDERTHAAIGELPRGRGVLGEMIRNPEPLRLADVGEHPRSCGFPAGHPPMRTFLGVAIRIRGETWGSLYLAEKGDGEDFDEGDEAALAVLADWAAIAIENARLYRASRGGATRSSVNATRRSAAEGPGRDDGHRPCRRRRDGSRPDPRADRQPRPSLGGDARAADPASRRRRAGGGGHGGRARERPGRCAKSRSTDTLPGGCCAPGAPNGSQATRARRRPRAARRLGGSGLAGAARLPRRPLGVLRRPGPRGERARVRRRRTRAMLRSLAASAATAVATAKSVEAERLRQQLEAAEQERHRWARELHDDTLQVLGALRMLHSAALRSGTGAAELRGADRGGDRADRRRDRRARRL